MFKGNEPTTAKKTEGMVTNEGETSIKFQKKDYGWGNAGRGKRQRIL